MNDTVAIVGSGVHGNIAAALLKKNHPDLDVVVVGPEVSTRPIVGESMTEFSVYTMEQIGLGDYLKQEQFYKYGLTYYLKQDLANPDDRTYAVLEGLAIAPMPSYQLNRFTFDRKLVEHNKSNGVRYIDGRAIAVNIDGEQGHELTVRLADHQTAVLSATWIVDASGRGRFLAKQLGLDKKAPLQRSTFWFRLVDFDDRLLANLRAVKPPQDAYPSYCQTHHFLGRGNWIWCIPMSTPDHRNMISIGIVWRPDLYMPPVRNMKQFIERVGEEHPVVVELTQSGTVADTNLYFNYFYESKQLYSTDRWFIVGDAGNTVDPLYSTGFAMSSAQAHQVSAMIEQDRSSGLTEELVSALDLAAEKTHHLTQYEIGTLYDVIDDPYQSCWRIQLSVAYYFYFLLPAWLNGYMNDLAGASFMSRVLLANESRAETLRSLVRHGSMRRGPYRAHEVPNIFDRTINWDLSGPGELDMAEYLARLSFLFAQLRFRFLRDAGWKDWPRHFAYCLADLARGFALRFLLRGRSLKASALVRSAVRLGL
jgi:flavin-dependent dehydrogenase